MAKVDQTKANMLLSATKTMSLGANKNYNQHEVADCLTLSYREVNRD